MFRRKKRKNKQIKQTKKQKDKIEEETEADNPKKLGIQLFPFRTVKNDGKKVQ